MRYKTCVSIAKETPYKIRQTLDIALKRSEYAEVRFDFLRIEDIPEAIDIIKEDMDRIVCTLRPETEGGKFSESEKERASILKLIAEYNPFLLDVEFDTIRRDLSLKRYLRASGTRLLISWHDFEETPSSIKLVRKMGQMGRFSSNVKLVCTARSIADSNRMLELYSKKRECNLISFAMGDFGRFSRILCLYLGSPYTYVSLGRAVAPGQFSVDDMKKITDRLSNS